MAIREIIRMGHPTLRQQARPVAPEELGGQALQKLVADMVETLHDAGGIGLAAPQVNEPIQVAIIEIAGGASRYGEIPAIPLTVFINPLIEVIDEVSAGYWEGCLSVPGLRGYVERPQHVKVRALNMEGESFGLELQGFLATVLQHELDHLQGKLYIDRLKDPSLLVFEDMLGMDQRVLEE